MALYNERDLQAQRRWHARLTRERLNLSESVGATLADAASLEQWDDDEGENAGRSAPNTALIPPRLSLQSKSLPAVRSGGFVQSATAPMAAHSSASHETAEEQKPQHTGILARLAQRLTSSLAAFGSSMQPEEISLFPPDVYHNSAQPYNETQITNISAIMPAERANTSNLTVIDAIPATPSTTPPQPVQSKQRLAGHTGKIRLQNASPPQATRHVKDREVREPSPELVREPVVVHVRAREKTQETTHPELLAVMSSREEATVASNNAASGYKAFFGASAFEGGQGDVMVTNTHVESSSVVQVTLTSSPGQTLVQYVSLYPQLGFTVHLTAPAAAKTTFNYVVLSQK